ncbi:MAG: phage holin family protein [Candidatus Pacebacteria bacterium]|jgi:putative membrane protein|nr:phage holin family protein [Candidatus Paceibacterota bacterium]
MNILISLIVNGLSVLISAYIVPGVQVSSFLNAVVVAVVLGILNSLIKPLLILLTLPINLLTLGLFSIVINVFILYLAANIVPGFKIDGFLSALIFGVILSIVSSLLGSTL